MKIKIKTPPISITLMTMMVGTAIAQPPVMKMNTEIPDGIATPDTLETSLGTLKSFDGVPDDATTQLVYDNLALQRAQHAYLSTIQISSMYAMEQGLRKFGPPNKTALLFEDLMDSKALWLTPNTVSSDSTGPFSPSSTRLGSRVIPKLSSEFTSKRNRIYKRDL